MLFSSTIVKMALIRLSKTLTTISLTKPGSLLKHGINLKTENLDDALTIHITTLSPKATTELT